MTMDSNASTVFSNPNTQRKAWEHLCSKIQTWTAFCCWTVCSELGLIQNGQVLFIEPDLRHAPLNISESGCNTNTEAVNTPREKLQDKLVLDGRRCPILNRNEATRYRSACMRLSYLAQDRLDLAETAKHLAQRMSKPREFDFVLLNRTARYLVGKPKAALRFRRQNMLTWWQSWWTATLLATQSRRRVWRDWWLRQVNHTVKSGSTLQNLTALSVGEAEFYAVVKGGQVELSLRSMYQDLGIPMKAEKTKWQFDGEFFDGPVASWTTNETHGYTIHLGTRTSSRWRSQY